jgi:DNA processing protein
MEYEISDEALMLAWLNKKFSLTSSRYKQIQSAYGNDLLAAINDSLEEIRKTGAKWLADQDLIFSQKDFASIQDELEAHDMGLISFTDSNYPASLRQLPNFPVLLFYKGNKELLDKKGMLTVVGSRSYTKYGESVLEQILRPLCRQGVGVVSGMALGIDGLSHLMATEEKAPTIGVVGSGLDQASFYPGANLPLATKVLEQRGLLLSEYQPGTKGNIYTFPNRNRILAALTEVTWVAQAGRQSGSLITADLAFKMGKKLATTPGQITDQTFFGNLDLLKTGATLISETGDLSRLLGLYTSPQETLSGTPEFSSVMEEVIYRQLDLKPLNVDEISQKISKSVVEIQTVLSLMELSGYVKSVGDNEWIRLG